MLKITRKIQKLLHLMGKEVQILVLVCILLGLILFLIESSFIYVIQGFLISINLLKIESVTLPSWYPKVGLYPVLLFLCFGISRGIMYMLKFYISSITSQAFIHRVRKKIVQYSMFNADFIDLSQVINIYNERIPVSGWVLQLTAQIAMSITTAFFLFFLGLKLAPKEMIISIILCAVVVLPLRVFNKQIGEFGSKQRNESDLALKNFITGMKHNFLIRIYDLLQIKISEIHRSNDLYRKYNHKYYLISAIRTYFPNIVGITVLCLVLISSKFLNSNLSSIEYVSFFYIFIRFAQTLSDTNGNLADVRLNYGAVTQVYDWFEKATLNEYDDFSNENKTHDREIIKIQCVNLKFIYPSSEKIIFENVSFEIFKGESMLIKGKSGAGKSTLLKLLSGVEKPTFGDVIVNNEKILNIKKAFLKKVGYVGPEPFIINGTIRDNLKFGQTRDYIEDMEMIEALEKVELNSIVDLEFMINELSGLSTGQKQRLSLARALLRKPEVLILDEATANLDEITEKNIINVLKNMANDLIIVIVSHKPSFDGFATKIINL